MSRLDHVLKVGLDAGTFQKPAPTGAGWTDDERENHAKFIPEMNELVVEGAWDDKIKAHRMVGVSTDPYNPTEFYNRDDDLYALRLKQPTDEFLRLFPNKLKHMVESERVKKGWVFYAHYGGRDIDRRGRWYIVARSQADFMADTWTNPNAVVEHAQMVFQKRG